MTAPLARSNFAKPAAVPEDWMVVTVAGERLAVPMDLVDAIAPPPRLAAVPHAPAALLGAGNLNGRIVPIVDLGRLLGRASDRADYDGRGDVVQLRIAEGRVGIWVDRVERVAHRGDADTPAGDGIVLLDAARLAADCLAAPRVAAGAPAALGEVAELAAPPAAGLAVEASIVVEAAGQSIQLHQSAVLELIDELPWVAVPRAPAGFLGVGWLRGAALPVLSLAVLLGLPAEAAPGGFVAIALGGRRLLLGVARMVGLRTATERGAIDPETLIPDELRQIVLGFSAVEEQGWRRFAAIADSGVPHLSFSVAGQDCAVPIAAVDRVIGAEATVPMPRVAMDRSRHQLDGAIELRGQIVPVASLAARFTGTAKRAAAQPDAYVILRGAGLGAIGADRIDGVIRLRPDEIASPPTDAIGAISGVAARPDGMLLRIIAPDRLWGSA